MPLKLVILPAEPPVTLRADQSQVPVHEPEPQLTATRCASLFTESEFVLPTKLTPYGYLSEPEQSRVLAAILTESFTPVPGVPRVSG